MKSFILIWIARVSKIICCLSVLFFTKNSKACGPDFSNYYLTYLLEHYDENSKYYDLQFDPNNRYYRRNYSNTTESTTGKKSNVLANISAWRNYLTLGTNISDSNLINIIYEPNLATTIFNSANPDINIFKAAIHTHAERKNMEKYLVQMQKYKNTMVPRNAGDWNYISYTNSIAIDSVEKFCNACIIDLKETKSEFLQWRYLYLILRAYHFNKHFSKAIETFTTYKKLIPNTNSLEQYWCEGIAGGAYIKANQNAEGIYYTARTFYHNPDFGLEQIASYDASSKDWKLALPLCKNGSDSIALMLLASSRLDEPCLEVIKQVYAMNPKHEAIKILWLREASKYEAYFYNSKEYDYTKYINNSNESKNLTKQIKENGDLKKFVTFSKEILQNPFAENKATITNMLAYICFRLNDLKSATIYLAIAKNAKKDSIETHQMQIIEEVVNLRKNNKINFDYTINLLQNLNKNKTNNVEYNMKHYYIYNELAPYFLRKKDTITAYWLYAANSNLDVDSTTYYIGDYSPEAYNISTFDTYLLLHHFSITQLQQLQSQYDTKKSNNALQNYLFTKVVLKNGKDLFSEIIIKKYMMMQAWEKAIALLPKLSSKTLSEKRSNPANFTIIDKMDDYYNSKNNSLPQKTMTLAKILDLAKTLKQNADKKIAKDQFLYGCLLYNLSFYGKNHDVIDNHWNHSNSSVAPYYFSKKIDAYFINLDVKSNAQAMSPLFHNYYYCTDAEAYLHKSLARLQTAEEKANCLWMMAKCWQKRCPVNINRDKEYHYILTYGDYVGNSLQNPYFRQLENEYANTNAYQNVKGNCDYFKMYIAQ